MIKFRSNETGIEDNSTIAVDNLWITENCKDYEVIDLSYQNFNIKGMKANFNDLSSDIIFKHADFSGNLSESEISTPENAIDFFSSLQDLLFKNGKLTSLDFSNNHLFGNFPHPSNEHLKNYVSMFTDLLLMSKVKHLNISNNNIVGTSRQQTLGLSILTKKFIKKRARSFICRESGLHSVCFCVISGGLGVFSNIIHLDLSDNQGGLHPLGHPSPEGANAIALQLSQSLCLRVLILARNHFTDEHCITIVNGLERTKTLEVLDLSGNQFGALSGAALKELIVNHSLFSAEGEGGIRILKISHCPLMVEGVEEISEGIKRSESLRMIEMNHCDIDDEGMRALRSALELNHSITAIHLHGNKSSKTSLQLVQAEVFAQKLLGNLKKDPMALDTSKLKVAVQNALIRKLKQLTPEQLYPLYQNPSFNHPPIYQQYREAIARGGVRGEFDPQVALSLGGSKTFLSPLRLALEDLAPPTRNDLFQSIRNVKSVQERLEESEERVRHLKAILTVKKPIMRVVKRLREAQAVARAIEEMRLRNLQLDQMNVEDEEWAAFSIKDKG